MQNNLDSFFVLFWILRGQSILDPCLQTRLDHSTWKSVLQGSELLGNYIGWRVGKGDVESLRSVV